MSKKSHAFPPLAMVDPQVIADTAKKTKRLERLYHLTQEHSWDGRAVLGGLIEKHGAPGKDLDETTRAALSRVLGVLMWGEFAAWNISADLALEIQDMDAKMAATAQVFDEARHFYVMRDYVMALGPVAELGGLPKRLLKKVLDAPTLAMKLVGMQLLFETNAVVIFRGLEESQICPVLSGVLPYFERDESRHVGLGAMYIPRLIEKMSRTEAAATARFQIECLLMLIGGGFTLRDDFEHLGLDHRLAATRVTEMQHDIVQQMAKVHGKGVLRALVTPSAGFGPKVLDFMHPPQGIENATPLHRSVFRGVMRGMKALDRALA